MATVNVQPLFLNDARVTIGADEFSAAISSVAFTPSASPVTFRGLRPDASFTRAAGTTWACDVTFAQDWTSENSLSRYLFEHEGEVVSAVFTPEDGATPVTITAELSIIPGAIGGAVDTFATATVSLGVVGRPVVS